MAVDTAPSTQTSGPPATPKQIETLARMERTLGIPKASRTNPEGLTRAEASELISSLINQMSRLTGDEDNAPTGQPSPREVKAQAAERQKAEDKIASVEQATGQPMSRTMPPAQPQQRDLDALGEWPPEPAQSSDHKSDPQSKATVYVGPNSASTTAPAPAARANPFDAPAGEDDVVLGTLGDEDADEDPELYRVVPAPVGGPFAFQITSADWVPPRSSQYGGIRLTVVGLPVGDEQQDAAAGTEAQDYLSMSPASRWRHEKLLAAINVERCKRSQLPGRTFWATTEADNYEFTNDAGEARVTKRTRIKDYLEGESPKPIKTSSNGAAPRATVRARLGTEFDPGRDTPFG